LTSYKDFPDAAKRYIDRLTTIMESEVSIISTGHGREHAVVHNPIF
jgi:adenylosuccinate synthase